MIPKPLRSSIAAAALLAACIHGSGCDQSGAPAESGGSVDQAQQPLLLVGAEVRSGIYANRCLDVASDTAANGVNVQSAACTGSARQKWIPTAAGELRSALNSSYCLEIYDAVGPAPGTNVQLNVCNGGPRQQWTPGSNGELRSTLAPNLCLDVSGGYTAAGANVQLWNCNGWVAQHWFNIPPVPVTANGGGVAITINDAHLNGGGRSLVRVAPGAQIQVGVNYRITQSTTCLGCVDQILIGLVGGATNSPLDCIYSGIPSPTGTSSTGWLYFNAPSTPGVYNLRFRYGQQGYCDLSWWSVNGTPGEAANFAVISVE